MEKDTPAAPLPMEAVYGGGSAKAKERFAALKKGMTQEGGFPAEFLPQDGEIRFFSAPGRTELGGNHTDHNNGRVLAASVDLDSIAAVCVRRDSRVFIRSEGFADTLVNLCGDDGRSGLFPMPEEQGTTAALVRGIAAVFTAKGAQVGGFTANVSSLVPQGSGLSSSASMEVLVAKIFDSLYCGNRFSPLELAMIGQEAENVFFGKPCGLMDQAACATGGVVAIDFADKAAPDVKKIAFDPLAAGYALCVVDTGGSHADLTPDYAAVPQEMHAVARFMGVSVLRETDLGKVMSKAGEIRKSLGDRALLRAIHFFNENRRAQQMAELLEKFASAGSATEKQQTMEGYLDLVNESGDSSWEILQNMYSPSNHGEQGLTTALAVSREFFRENSLKAACRVHGGGFAGTVQAYIPAAALDRYKTHMENLFGQDSLKVLRIRQVGAVEV
jgi:galactokinase